MNKGINRCVVKPSGLRVIKDAGNSEAVAIINSPKCNSCMGRAA